MTQERIAEIKAFRDGYDYDSSYINLLNELISTVEELQQIPLLIERILMKRYSLEDLYYIENGKKFAVLLTFDEEEGIGFNRIHKEFDSLLLALQFILQRTTK